MTRKGKYDSDAAEILHAMCLDGWAEDEIGDAEEGLFIWRISTDITTDDREIWHACLGRGVLPTQTLISEIRGHFIVSVNSDGFVTVKRQDTYEESKARFDEIERTYFSTTTD